jgi:tripartite-type tricarboxylate transporter receptor subunit TctC
MRDDDNQLTGNRRAFLKYTGAASAAAMTGLAGCSGEDGEYPNEDLRYIVPFSEGGGTDTYARQIIPEMSNELGVEIAIENISGAASLRGTGELYNSDADGYTFGGFNPPSTPVSYMVNPQEWEMTDLKGVGAYARTPFVIVANTDYGIEGFDDLVQRYQDGDLEIFAGKERGGVDHVMALLLKNNEDFQMDWNRYVGYDGSGPAVQAAISDEVPVTISTDTAAAGAVEDGRLDTVVALSSEGTSVFPDLEDVTDSGYPAIDFIGQLRRCMYVPDETSDERIEVLSSALETACQSDAVQEWSEESGNVIDYGGPEAADAAIQDAFEQIPDNVDLEQVREEAN